MAFRSFFFYTSLCTILIFIMNLFSFPINILALECINLSLFFGLFSFGSFINCTLLATKFIVIDESGETNLHGVANWIWGSEVKAFSGTVIGGELSFFVGGLATGEILPLNGGNMVRGTTGRTGENWRCWRFGFCGFLFGLVEVRHFHPLFRRRVKQLYFYLFYFFR